MIIEPYRRAIQDRLRRRRENVGPYPLAPTTVDISAHYASMPLSIEKASDLCGFTQHSICSSCCWHLSFCVKAPNVTS